MTAVGYALWLALGGVRLLVEFWAVSLTLLVGTFLLFRVDVPRNVATPQLGSLSSILLMFPVAILLWGGFAAVPLGELPPGSTWRITALIIIWVLYAFFSLGLYSIARGQRSRIVFSIILVLWLMLICTIQSLKVLTGSAELPESILLPL